MSGFGQSSGFGQPSNNQSSTGFGQQSSGFGASAGSFGKPAFGQSTTPSTGFGISTSTTGNTGFGSALGQTNSGFGQSTSGFGQNNTATGFGQNNTATGFGQNNTTTGFGQLNTQNKTGFGTGSSGFGQTSSAFGQTASTLGASTNAFGKTNTGFGQTSSAFGQTNTGFGQTTSAFGQANTGFGQASIGASQGSSAFGQTNTGFGQTSSAFGQSLSGLGKPSGGFGQTNTGFGQTTSAFGQNTLGFGQNTSAFGTQNKPSFGITGILNNSTGATGSLLSGGAGNTQSAPAASILDPRINHFLASKSDMTIDQLPEDAQKLLSEIQQALNCKKKSLAGLRNQMQSVENELQFVSSEISDAIIGTKNVDLLLKSGVNKLEQLENRQVTSSDLIPVQSLNLANKEISNSNFNSSAQEAIKQINSEVSYQAMQYETAMKKLDVASNNLQSLAKLDQSDGLKSYIGAQHIHMCELSLRANNAMARSQQALSSYAGPRLTESLRESQPRSLISSLYAPRDFNFDPTLFEIACEDLTPQS